MIAKVIPAKAGARTFGVLVDYVTAENRLDRPKGREFDELVRYVGREDTVDPITGEVTAKAIAIETQGSRRYAPRRPRWKRLPRNVGGYARRRTIISSSPGTSTSTQRSRRSRPGAMRSRRWEWNRTKYVIAVHGDTANAHLHVAVNRVDPETYRAVSPFRDYIQLDRAMREIELAQGWSHDRGPTQVTVQAFSASKASKSELNLRCYTSLAAVSLQHWLIAHAIAR